ncbi:MAG TPA: tetratricopeptide repeat protein, partial [Tepidisphaeraceae bacterium]
FVSRTLARAWDRRRQFYLPLLGTWILLALLVLRAGDRGGTVISGQPVPHLDYLRTQVLAIARYLKLSFWPAPLVLDYGNETVQSLGSIIPEVLLLILLVVATVVAFFRWPRAAFLGVAFFTLLAPSSSVIPINQTMAEHRMYLPLACVVAAVAIAAWSFVVRRLGVLGGGQLLWAMTAAATVALCVVTFARNATYDSELSIWQDTLSKQPSSVRAESGVGVALLNENRPQEALPHLMRAVQLTPDDAGVHNNLGNVYTALNQYSAAVPEFDKSLQLRPRSGRTYYNRAVAYYRLQKFAEAWADVEQARRLGVNPDAELLKALAPYAPGK